jgi:hypothetical protein
MDSNDVHVHLVDCIDGPKAMVDLWGRNLYYNLWGVELKLYNNQTQDCKWYSAEL